MSKRVLTNSEVEISKEVRRLWEPIEYLDGRYLNYDDDTLSIRAEGIAYIKIFCQKYGAKIGIELAKKYGNRSINSLEWLWFAMAGIKEVESELRNILNSKQDLEAAIGLAYLGFEEGFDFIQKQFFEIYRIEEIIAHLRWMNNLRADELASQLRFRLKRKS